MLDQNPVVGGSVCEWSSAYRAQMRASGGGSAPELADAYGVGLANDVLPGHSMVWFYDSNPLAGHQLPGAPMKYMCCAPFSALLQQASVVRAPFDIIIEDGLLIVATTHTSAFRAALVPVPSHYDPDLDTQDRQLDGRQSMAVGKPLTLKYECTTINKPLINRIVTYVYIYMHIYINLFVSFLIAHTYIHTYIHTHIYIYTYITLRP